MKGRVLTMLALVLSSAAGIARFAAWNERPEEIPALLLSISPEPRLPSPSRNEWVLIEHVRTPKGLSRRALVVAANGGTSKTALPISWPGSGGEDPLLRSRQDSLPATGVGSRLEDYDIVWSPDRKYLCVSGVLTFDKEDKVSRIHVFERTSDAFRYRTSYRAGQISGGGWSPDGIRFCYLSDGGLYVADVRSKQTKLLVSTQDGPLPNRRVNQDGSVEALSASRMKMVSALPPKRGPLMFDAHWSPDGRHLAISEMEPLPNLSADVAVEAGLVPCIYDLDSGAYTVLGDSRIAGIVGYSSDGRRLYCRTIGTAAPSDVPDGSFEGRPAWFNTSGAPGPAFPSLPGYTPATELAVSETPVPYEAGLRSSDGYTVLSRTLCWSRDGGRIGFWEGRLDQGGYATSLRFSLWKSGKPFVKIGEARLEPGRGSGLVTAGDVPAYSFFSSGGSTIVSVFESGFQAEISIPRE